MKNFFAMLLSTLLAVSSVCAVTNPPAATSAPAEAAQLAAELEDTLKALAKDHYGLQTTEAGGKAIEAAVRTQDPAARLLTRAQADAIAASQTGFACSVSLRFAFSNACAVATEASGGVLPGDILLSVDGAPALTLVSLLNLLRSDTPSTARLEFLRGKSTQTMEFARSPLALSAVEVAEKLPRDLGYIKINGLFSPDAGRSVVAILRGWSETGRYGFILDLRGAGGGDLKAATAIASLFATEGSLLFSFRDRDNQDVSVHKALSGDPLVSPVIALVDEQTRGASEALAAALSDSVRGALLVGSPTSGDPLIRDVLELPGGRLIYLARRQLVTANGKTYDGTAGIMPSVLATNAPTNADFYEPAAGPDRRATLDQELEDRALRDRTRGDIPLRTALDLLSGLKALNLKAGGVSSD